MRLKIGPEDVLSGTTASKRQNLLESTRLESRAPVIRQKQRVDSRMVELMRTIFSSQRHTLSICKGRVIVED